MEETSSINNILKRKKEAKAKFSSKYSFSKKKPLLGIILDNELDDGDVNKVHILLEAVAQLDIEVIVLADSNLDSLCLPNVIYLPYSRKDRNMLLQASDMALAFSFNDVEELMLNGVIPISSTRPEILDYNPSRETGNGFIYKKENPWAIFEALVRARETFKLPYDWKHIVRTGMSCVKS